MPVQRLVEAPSGPLVVHTWEPVGHPTHLVLLAHGYAEHAGRYDYVANRLTATGARVIAPDQRGHGLSSGPRGRMVNMDSYATDLFAILKSARSAFPLGSVSLIGHSMGGIIATRLVQLHPDSIGSLVLSGPVVGGNPDVFELLDQASIPETPVDPAVLSRDPAIGACFAVDPLVYHGPYQRQTIRAYMKAVDRIAADGTLGAIPTLWMHGTDDRLAPLGATRAAIERIKGPELEVITYPGARHEIFNETNRDVVLDDLIGFLDRVRQRAAASPAKTYGEQA